MNDIDLEKLLLNTISIRELSILKEKYNKSFYSIIKENPYILLNFESKSFSEIDAFAKELDIKPENSYRIKAIIMSTINYLSKLKGNTIFSLEDILNEIEKRFKISKSLILDEINILYYLDKIVYFNNKKFLTSKGLYDIEHFIYETVKKESIISKGSILNNNSLDEFIKDEEKRIGFNLSDKQKKIIKLANNRFNIFSLNGYAGAGKTTSAESILTLYTKVYDANHIICCALSGVAANRAKNVTGFDAKTIHSLLQYREKGFMFNETNKLSYKLIMIDEASMTDAELFYNLLLAIDFNKTSLLIVGDAAQLKSVGAGDIYKLLLDYNVVKTITLDKVYRQREDQFINLIAQSIRKNEIPDYTNSLAEDVDFINENDIENIEKEISIVALDFKEEMENYIKVKDYEKFIDCFQVISPMKKNRLGVYDLNKQLQQIFNPFASKQKKFSDKTFKHNDKVIHLKNTFMTVISLEDAKDKNFYQLKDDEKKEVKVFNGQTGVIIKMLDNNTFVYYPSEDYVAIYQDYHFKYEYINLAYCITVHKSQGSQYNNVIVPFVNSHKRMLNTNLLYTAVTRAKEMLYLIGEDYVFETACTNTSSSTRKTVLEELLKH